MEGDQKVEPDEGAAGRIQGHPAELRITSRTTQGEYRLLFKRRSLYEPGDFYLASAGKQIRLHEVLLFQLLKNTQRGNYAVRSSLTINQGCSSRERIHIYSNQPFKPKGEGTDE